MEAAFNPSGRPQNDSDPHLTVEFADRFLSENKPRNVEIRNESATDLPKELFAFNPSIDEIGLLLFNRAETLNGGAIKEERAAELSVHFFGSESRRTFTLNIPEDLVKIPTYLMTEISGVEDPVEAYKLFYPIKQFILETDKKTNPGLEKK